MEYVAYFTVRAVKLCDLVNSEILIAGRQACRETGRETDGWRPMNKETEGWRQIDGRTSRQRERQTKTWKQSE